MIASEKSHKNLSVDNQFLFKKRFKVNKKKTDFFLVKELEINVVNSVNCIYDYFHSLLRREF